MIKIKLVIAMLLFFSPCLYSLAQDTSTQADPLTVDEAQDEDTKNETRKSRQFEKSTEKISIDTTGGAILEENITEEQKNAIIDDAEAKLDEPQS